MKVRLCANYFRSWWVFNFNWYRSVESIIQSHSIPCIKLTYEDDISNEDRTLQKIILRMFENFGAEHEFRADMKPKGLYKQDQERKYTNKITNWSTFIEELSNFDFENRAFSAF